MTLIVYLLTQITSGKQLSTKLDSSFEQSPFAVCGGHSRNSGWHLVSDEGNYRDNVIYRDVDTKSCPFRTPPRYSASLVSSKKGDLQLQLTTMIAIPTSSSFRFIVMHKLLRGRSLATVAKSWKVSWIAATGEQSGDLSPGSFQLSRRGPRLHFDVNTSASMFAQTPHYVLSLYSTLSLPSMMPEDASPDTIFSGGVDICNEGRNGFRFYTELISCKTNPLNSLKPPKCISRAHPLTAVKTLQWGLTWIGVSGERPCVRAQIFKNILLSCR